MMLMIFFSGCLSVKTNNLKSERASDWRYHSCNQGDKYDISLLSLIFAKLILRAV